MRKGERKVDTINDCMTRTRQQYEFVEQNKGLCWIVGAKGNASNLMFCNLEYKFVAKKVFLHYAAANIRVGGFPTNPFKILELQNSRRS